MEKISFPKTLKIQQIMLIAKNQGTQI